MGVTRLPDDVTRPAATWLFVSVRCLGVTDLEGRALTMNAYSVAKLGAAVAVGSAAAKALLPPEAKAAGPAGRWEPPAEAERRRLARLAEADPLDLARMQRLVDAVEAEKVAGARLVRLPQNDFTAVVRYGRVTKRLVLVSVDEFGDVTRSGKPGEVLPPLV